MKIFYKDNEIQIDDLQEKIKVSHLLKALKKHLKIENIDLILIELKNSQPTSFSVKDLNSEIEIKDSSSSQLDYILFQTSNQTQSEKKTESLDNIIMKVTGASKKIETKTKLKNNYNYVPYTQNSRIPLDFFERMTNDPSFLGNNENSTRQTLEYFRGLLNLSNQNLPNSGFDPRIELNTGNNESQNQNPSQVDPHHNIHEFRYRYPIRNRAPVVPEPALIQNLVEMGFEEDRAKRALIASKNRIDHATEMLLNGHDIEFEEARNFNPYSFLSQGSQIRVPLNQNEVQATQNQALSTENQNQENQNNPNANEHNLNTIEQGLDIDDLFEDEDFQDEY